MLNMLDKTRAELSASNRPTGGGARPVFIASVVVTVVLAAMLLGCPLSWDWRVGISPGRLALLVAMATSALAAGLAGERLRRRRLQDLAEIEATARGLEDQRRQTVMLRRALVACSSGDMDKGLRRLLSQVCRGVGIQAGGVVVASEAGSISTLVSTYRMPTGVSEQTGDHLAAITEWIERAATMTGPAVTSTAKWTALTEFGLSGRVLAVPLTADERLQGVMVLAVHERFERLHPAHQRFMDEVAESMATAIDVAHQTRSLRSANRTLEEKVRDRTFELEVLLELSQVIGHALDYPQLLRLLVEHSHWVVSCDVAACLSLAPAGAPEGTPDEITIRPLRPITAATSREIANALESAVAKYTPGGHMAERRGVPTIVAEPPDPSAPAVDSLTSSVVVPICAGEHGRLWGLLLVGSEAPNAFPAERVRLLTKVASRAGRAVGQLRALLNDEQKRLEQVVASLPEGVILLDGELRARLVTPQARSCLQSLGEVTVTVGEVLERLGASPLADLLDGSERSDMVEIVGLHDPERVFGLRTSPVTAGPEAGGYVLTIQELTEQRRDQARIAQQGRMAAVGQLAAGIAHDFNNLLTSVIGRAELLLLDAELDGDMLEDVTVIRDQGRRAAEMIQQILDFSRRSNPGLRSVDLARAVRKATDLLVRTIPEHIRIQLDLGSGLLPVMANTTQLQQVLTNLAVNARDAMPDGGLLRVSLSRQRFVAPEPTPFADMHDRDWAVVQVSDTGVGMPPEVCKRIFEPFFTTKPVGEGTGLGLAQTYGIVGQHGGHIDVTTRPGEGTTFTIWLPLQRRKTSETDEELPCLATQSSDETALVVEDDPQVLAILHRLIGRMGYRVVTAANGSEGLAVFERLQPEIQLVITDLTMPEMSGVEFYKRLRTLDTRVPVIVLSGYPFGNLIDSDDMEGVSAWVTKPPSLSALAKAIEDSRFPPGGAPCPSAKKKCIVVAVKP